MLLYWGAIFLVIAIIAGLFGFSGVKHGATEIAKTLFFIFVVLFIIALISNILFPGSAAVI